MHSTGTLKGDFARTRTIQDAQDITSDMGLEFVRTLSARGLSHMAGNSLPRDIHRNFRNADLVIEATDGTDTRYIAMEISFTVDRRDCAGPYGTPGSTDEVAGGRGIS